MREALSPPRPTPRIPSVKKSYSLQEIGASFVSVEAPQGAFKLTIFLCAYPTQFFVRSVLFFPLATLLLRFVRMSEFLEPARYFIEWLAGGAFREKIVSPAVHFEQNMRSEN
jgi:hypothetical protein